MRNESYRILLERLSGGDYEVRYLSYPKNKDPTTDRTCNALEMSGRKLMDYCRGLDRLELITDSIE